MAEMVRQDFGFEPTESQKIARSIMGRNFFGIEEAMRYWGFNPTANLVSLAEISCSLEILRECKDTHTLRVITSDSISDVRKKSPKNFYDQSWYNNEPFASRQGEVGWRLVRKTPVPDSFSKNWVEQQALLGEDEEVPDARVVTQVVIGHFLATGERLLLDKYVRTSSFLDSDGSHVCAGAFDSGGFRLYYVWDGNRDAYVGLASSRKF